jgi:hypothetical protein
MASLMVALGEVAAESDENKTLFSAFLANKLSSESIYDFYSQTLS